MSNPRPIFWRTCIIFYFRLYFHYGQSYGLMSKGTLGFFAYFSKYVALFLNDNVDEK